MAERTDELREDIERRRHNISHTVDQVQNRVSPGRMMARGRYRMRRWLIDTKDQLMGNDEPYYPWQGTETDHREPRDSRGEGASMTEQMSETASRGADRASEMASEVGHQVSDAASTATEAMKQAPQQLRRQTRGNPMAAGLIAFGGGLLVGSLLPETRAEHEMTSRLEPAMATAMSEAKEAGREVAEDLKDDARDSMESVKEAGAEAGQHLKEDAREAAERTRDRTRDQ